MSSIGNTLDKYEHPPYSLFMPGYTMFWEQETEALCSCQGFDCPGTISAPVRWACHFVIQEDFVSEGFAGLDNMRHEGYAQLDVMQQVLSVEAALAQAHRICLHRKEAIERFGSVKVSELEEQAFYEWNSPPDYDHSEDYPGWDA